MESAQQFAGTQCAIGTILHQGIEQVDTSVPSRHWTSMEPVETFVSSMRLCVELIVSLLYNDSSSLFTLSL